MTESALICPMRAPSVLINIEPRMGLKWNITNNLRFKAAAGRYSQNLVAANSDRDVVNLFYGFLSSPDNLQEDFTEEDGTTRKIKDPLQRANHYLAGFEVDITNEITLNLEGYLKDFRQVTNLNRDKLFEDSPDFADKPDELKKDYVVETGKGVDTCTVGDLVTVSPLLSCVPRGISPVCPVCAAGRPGNCEHFAEGAFAPGLFAGICRDVGGGFAEYMVAHKSQVFPVPKGVSPEAATLTEPFAVGIQTVLDNRPEEKDRVLVIGGGVIGTMIVKAIRGLGIGCTITVVEPAAFNAAVLGFLARHADAGA